MIGLRILKRGDFAICLSDIEMPEKSGLKMVEELRLWEKSMNKLPQKIICISGDDISEGEVLQHGMDRVIKVPFNINDVQNAIKSLI